LQTTCSISTGRRAVSGIHKDTANASAIELEFIFACDAHLAES